MDYTCFNQHTINFKGTADAFWFGSHINLVKYKLRSPEVHCVIKQFISVSNLFICIKQTSSMVLPNVGQQKVVTDIDMVIFWLEKPCIFIFWDIATQITDKAPLLSFGKKNLHGVFPILRTTAHFENQQLSSSCLALSNLSSGFQYVNQETF